MGQCFGPPKSPEKIVLPPKKPEPALPSQDPEKNEEEETGDVVKFWNRLFNNPRIGPRRAMTEVYKTPKNFFGNFVDKKRKWMRRLREPDLLVFEGAAFTLAECEDKLQRFKNENPYRFFGGILTSAAGYSLSHFFMDIIPEDVREKVFEDPAKPVLVVGSTTKRKRAKSGKSNSHKSLSSSLSSVSEKMNKATEYGDGKFTFTEKKRELLPSWLTARQELLLERYGYKTFDKVRNHHKNTAQLMNLCLSARNLANNAAKGVNKILNDNGRIKEPLLTLKQNPIALEDSEDTSSKSKRTQRYGGNKNRVDFSDIIEHLIHILDEFVDGESGGEVRGKIEWDNLVDLIEKFNFEKRLKAMCSGDKISTVAQVLTNKIPDYGDFMERNFELHPAVARWASGHIDWNQVKLETGHSLSIPEGDQLGANDFEGRLRTLLLHIYVNRVRIASI